MPLYKQIKAIHTLLPDYIKEDKELKGDLIQQYTEDPKKRSTKDLSNGQADELIAFLKMSNPPAQIDQKANRLRRKFLSICHQLGWYKKDKADRVVLNAEQKPVLDYARIDNWCEKHGKYHKTLQEHSYNELQKLISQFNEVMYQTVK
jgi:hypothetical protein